MTIQQCLKIVRIQEIDLFFTGKGFNRTYVYSKIIAPNFYISERTHYRYLEINAKRMLQEKGIDWRVELEKNQIGDYVLLMDALKNPTDRTAYYEMMKEQRQKK